MNDTVSPLYVDGPLQGEERLIPREQLMRGLLYDDENRPTTHGPPLVYHFHRFVLLSQVIWIGSLQTNLNAVPFEQMKNLFNVVASDRAKAAM